MRRVWIALTVISVALVMAVPVGAAVDCSLERFEFHPQCWQPTDPPPGEDGPIAGTTCAYLGMWGDPVTQDFEITLTGRKNLLCIDVLSGPGDWTADVAITAGSARMLLFIPRDSFAGGDSCGGYAYRSNNVPRTLSGTIPGSYVNSCGTDIAEMVDDVYYRYIQDGAWRDLDGDGVNEWYEYVESPLAFQINVAGSKDLEMTLTVDLPGVDNETVDVTPADPTP